MSEFEEMIKKADKFIELGTKIKEFSKKEYLNKTEKEMTEDELKDYREFIGYICLIMQEINN